MIGPTIADILMALVAGGLLSFGLGILAPEVSRGRLAAAFLAIWTAIALAVKVFT